MKVALLDSPHLSPWIDHIHRLSFMSSNIDGIDFVVVTVSGEEIPVLAGLGREGDIRPLIDAVAVVADVKRLKPDMCIVPLRGGLAHGILMARACGELSPQLLVAIIAEEPSKSIALRSDICFSPLRLLICDALERLCLEQADALLDDLSPHLDAIRSLGTNLPQLINAEFLTMSRGALIAGSGLAFEFCFVGSFTRACNIVTFIEMAEKLARERRLEQVVFIGQVSDASNAPGLEWLGRRAQIWPFNFRVIEAKRFEDALEYAMRPGRLSYVPDMEIARLRTLATAEARIFWLDPLMERNSSRLLAAVMAFERESCSVETVSDCMPIAASLRAVVERKLPPPDPTSLSICILHRDRPLLLSEAIESILTQLGSATTFHVEVIIFDNASSRSDSAAFLDRIESDPRVKVTRQKTLLAHSSAMNAMAACATKDYLVFLDDDNLMCDGGVAALLSACATGSFDVITSNLYIFDVGGSSREPTAKMVFIGPASTAGLFFNAFGDTCMAFRRCSFERIGGFFDAQGPSPAPDWVLLTRAQAKGLKIGVLQNPAFLYRRDIDRAEFNWQKYDQHGIRDLVLRHYNGKYDDALLAKFAQSMMIEFC